MNRNWLLYVARGLGRLALYGAVLAAAYAIGREHRR